MNLKGFLFPIRARVIGLIIIGFLLMILASQKSESSNHKAGNTMTQEKKMIRQATFAGGCFWCTESDFEKIPGVTKVISGYTGGHKKIPPIKKFRQGQPVM